MQLQTFITSAVTVMKLVCSYFFFAEVSSGGLCLTRLTYALSFAFSLPLLQFCSVIFFCVGHLISIKRERVSNDYFFSVMSVSVYL